ncbi:MAG: class I SAM-dependent methyltransferase [Methylocystis sp.]|nr:class I SAM-dependent methyltransferase [Methylocystis sp.]
MADLYDSTFYDWVKMTALGSARAILPHVIEAVSPASVVDIGCGEGAWLSVWSELGVVDILGLDGDYVRRDRLLLKPAEFIAADLSAPFTIARRFDLAQSLEVAEHLPPDAADGFVANLCALSDIVLFSAAIPGQGGEMHINEQRPSWWAERFAARGYDAFDALRPRLRAAKEVAPWYKFNTLIYANAAGQERLSTEARAARCVDPAQLDGAGDALWRLRCAMLAPLSPNVVTMLSRLRYRMATAIRRPAA